MQRPEGYRCPNSGRGFPHGKDQKQRRKERAAKRKLKVYDATSVTIVVAGIVISPPHYVPEDYIITVKP